MDPLTHALFGAAAARVLLARPLGPAAWLPGAAGALLPDVDALVRSSSDPLLYAEFHRHVTHALAVTPIGGAVAAMPWILRRTTRPRWPWWIAAAAAGYGTHGMLDAATTYGTSLFWPFSGVRVAWNVISIIDPVFTGVLLAGVTVAVWRRSAVPAAVALVLCVAWLGAGLIQRERARGAQAALAAARGHEIARADVFPAFGTTLVWRSLYQAGDTLHMDRLRVPWGSTWSWRAGPSVPVFREDTLPAAVRAHPRLRRDLRRFDRFAAGWLARDPDEADVVADARYSGSVDRFEPVWGVRFAPDARVPVAWVDRSPQRRIDPRALWRELIGRDPAHRPAPGAGNGG